MPETHSSCLRQWPLLTSAWLDKAARKLRHVHCRWRAAGRKQFARAVFALPGLRRSDPRRRVVTFKSYCREVDRFPADSANAGDWYLRLRSPETIRRRPSIAVDAEQAEQFRAGTQRLQCGNEFEVPELFLASLTSARILRKGLLTLSARNHIFFESAMTKPEVLESHGILDTVRSPRPLRLAGDYCMLGTPWAAGYYHWLLEALPRLSTLERFPQLSSAKLIVPEPLSAFQRESLALAGVGDNQLVQLAAPCVEVERFYFPQIPAPTGSPSPHAVAWLRERFSAAAGPAQSVDRRLYITRRDAPGRHLCNEDEVVDFLLRRGYEVVTLGGMSFADQIRLFAGARVVIAPHGAGCSNVLFSPAGLTLIEFFGRNYINGCFWALANICGHRHAFLTGEPTRLDFRISLAQLRRLLELLALD